MTDKQLKLIANLFVGWVALLASAAGVVIYLVH